MVQKEAIIKVDNNGNLTFLYDDNLMATLKEEGEATAKRASDLLWDNSEQRWFVHFPGSPTRMIERGFENRKEALAYEKKWLESKM